jgi:hypothetical protein
METQQQPQPPNGKIVEALLAIAAEVPAVGKDDTNEQQHYNFRSAEAVMAALKPLLVKHKVLIYPVRIVDSEHSKGPKDNGFRVVQRIVYRFEHIDGSYRDMEVTGEGVDYGDKSCNKVMTVSLKYGCGQMFFIPYYSEADPDKESPEFGPPGEQKGKASAGKNEPPKDAKQEAAEAAKRQKEAMDALVKLLGTKGVTGGKAVLAWLTQQTKRDIKKLSDLTFEEHQTANDVAEKLPTKSKATETK